MVLTQRTAVKRSGEGEKDEAIKKTGEFPNGIRYGVGHSSAGCFCGGRVL